MKYGLFLLFPLCLSACAKELNAHGWEDLELHRKDIIVGKMTQNDVVQILGQPSAKDVTQNKEWYYVQLIEEGFSIAKLKTKSHKMLKIIFDNKGVVQSATVVDIKPCAMKISKEKTQTTGYQEGFLKDTFGRIGQR